MAALLSLKSIPSYLGFILLKKFNDKSLLLTSDIDENEILLLFVAVNASVNVDFPKNSNDEMSGELISLIDEPKKVLCAVIVVCSSNVIVLKYNFSPAGKISPLCVFDFIQ